MDDQADKAPYPQDAIRLKALHLRPKPAAAAVIAAKPGSPEGAAGLVDHPAVRAIADVVALALGESLELLKMIGCAIGDMGTILFFQLTGIPWPVLLIMSLAIINGLLTSIALETFILARQMTLRLAFKTAIGMSLISMMGMETSP